MAYKFKVGDKVRVIAGKKRLENIGLDEEDIGTVGEIVSIDKKEKEIPYEIDTKDNVTLWFHSKDLELVEDVGHVKKDYVDNQIRTFGTGATRDTDVKPLEESLVEQLKEMDEEVTKKYYGHPRFYEILEQMKDLHSRKNHDYAGTSDPLKNLRSCKRLNLEPFMGVLVRLQDKWSRIEEFAKSNKLMVKGESVKDTLLDNAVYSILAIILYEEAEKEKK